MGGEQYVGTSLYLCEATSRTFAVLQPAIFISETFWETLTVSMDFGNQVILRTSSQMQMKIGYIWVD